MVPICSTGSARTGVSIARLQPIDASQPTLGASVVTLHLGGDLWTFVFRSSLAGSIATCGRGTRSALAAGQHSMGQIGMAPHLIG